MADSNNSTPKTPFDSLISHAQLDILKLLLPYIPPSKQRFMATFIKMQELERTIKYFDKFPAHDDSSSSHSALSLEFLSEIKPYLNADDGGILDTLLSTMSMMDLFQTMTPTNSDDSSGFSFDILKGMLTPEQQAMMNAFHATPDPDNNDFSKGDSENGQQMDEPSSDEHNGSNENGIN